MDAQLKTLDQNIARIIKQNAAATLRDAGRTHLSILPHVHPAGHTFNLVDYRLTVRQEAAIVFVDRQPQANWGHPCTYQFYDPVKATLLYEEDALFPPNLAGKISLELFHAPLAHPTPADLPVIRRLAMQQVQLVPLVDEQRYALLWTSQISNLRHVEDLEFLWRTLVNLYGFNADNVYVLCYDGTISATDVGPGGVGNWYGDNTPYQMKVHASATSANLQSVFNDLAGKLKPKDLLLIHTNNHGSPSGFCVDDTSVVTPTQFGNMLAGLPHFRSLVVTMEQCYSGAFQSSVISKSTAARTAFASAVSADKTSDSASHFDPWALALIEALMDATPAGAALPTDPSSNLHGLVSVKSACSWAKANDTGADDDPQYAENPSGCGCSIFLGVVPPLPLRAGDLNRDGCAEIIVTSPWGLGILEASGATMVAPVVTPNGTHFGGWLLNTADNEFGPVADYDAEGYPQVLATSPWGLGILKLEGGSLTPLMMQPNGTRLGNWLLNTADNRFGPVADYDGDGHAEILVSSPWGLGILKLEGGSLTPLMMQPNGTRLGDWVLDTVSNSFGPAADYDGDGRAEVVVSSPWGLGILKLAGSTMAAPMMQPNGTRFGGWLLDTSNNNFGLAADYDQDHRAELLVSSPWGLGILKLAGNTMAAPMMQLNGTRFGDWLLNTADNKFGPAADYDGEGRAEVLVRSPWGLGILKQGQHHGGADDAPQRYPLRQLAAEHRRQPVLKDGQRESRAPGD